jgi:hypothetical protein
MLVGLNCRQGGLIVKLLTGFGTHTKLTRVIDVWLWPLPPKLPIKTKEHRTSLRASASNTQDTTSILKVN